MEEKISNTDQYKIINLIDFIESFAEDKDNSIKIKKEFLEGYFKRLNDELVGNKGPYAKCIEDIYMYKIYENSDYYEYLKFVISICNKYLDIASGNKYHKNKQDIERRREKYKQLNITLLPNEKEEFKKATEKNGTTMKDAIKQFILEYIEKNKK
ncbi:MAG: hypothetical protein IJO32_00535 [Bacilli bacterium]|nr:hypothetical protein [Bacilli bacterium]